MEYTDPLLKIPKTDPEDILNVGDDEFLLVSRKGWGAKEPARPALPLTHPVENVVIAYNTDVEPCFNEEECTERMRELQQLHLDRGLGDIHYNFAVGTDGTVFEGRGWDYQPEPFMEKPELDETSICIGIIGDGKEPDNTKPLELITAIYLANHGVEQGYIIKDYTVCEDGQTFEIKPPA